MKGGRNEVGRFLVTVRAGVTLSPSPADEQPQQKHRNDNPDRPDRAADASCGLRVQTHGFPLGVQLAAASSFEAILQPAARRDNARKGGVVPTPKGGQVSHPASIIHRWECRS
jgi:hypothetical protein